MVFFRTGTFFENSSLPLEKIVRLIYLLSTITPLHKMAKETIERVWGLCKSMVRKQRTMHSRLFDTSEAENLGGGQGGLEPPHFLIRGGLSPPKIGGCHEERNSLCWMYSE